MSRSYRHNPIAAIAGSGSEKWDKQKANRKLRKRVKDAIRNNKEIPLLREVSNVWMMNKDGKMYFGDRHPKLMRK